METEPYVVSFGSLKFYRMESGQYVPLTDPEMGQNLRDWCSIEVEDQDEYEDDDFQEAA